MDVYTTCPRCAAPSSSIVRDGFFMLTDEGASAPKPDEMGDMVLGFHSHELLDDGIIFENVSDLESLAMFFARWNDGGR